MSAPLSRILYCSHNRTAGAGVPASVALDSILSSARANNRRCEVTGALLFNCGYFAQILEGPMPAIAQTFERIQRDPRHGNVTVLECSPIEKRDFPEWSMAHVHPASAKEDARAGRTLLEAMGNPGEAAREVLEMMRHLVLQQDETAA